MAIDWDSYRLARSAGYSRWQALRSAYSEFDPNDVEADNAARDLVYGSLAKAEIEAKLDAERAFLWKSGDENIEKWCWHNVSMSWTG